MSVIEYKYSPGETYRYRQSVTMVLDDPMSGRVGGKADYEIRFDVLKQNEDGTWMLQFTIAPVNTEGILKDYLPQDFVGRPVMLRIDGQGTLYGITGQKASEEVAPVAKTVYFPKEPLSEGDTWTIPGSSPEDQMQITYQVESFETAGESLIAHLLSNALTTDEQEGSRTEARASFSFDVTRGHQIKSITVIETNWHDRKHLSMVVEYDLIDCIRK